jgi:hypothetical protein
VRWALRAGRGSFDDRQSVMFAPGSPLREMKCSEGGGMEEAGRRVGSAGDCALGIRDCRSR